MSALARLVVAGTRSGVGKTVVATGLMAALQRRGLMVSGHKVGPDFIDPGYHALATGRVPRNLDSVLHGPHRIAPLLAHGAQDVDVAIIEGVMGLYDGRGSEDTASTAQVARRCQAPVLLVVDVSGSSRSVAAEIHGFATFDRGVRLAGVVLNKVASPRHERVLRDALAPLPVPVVGALHRRPTLTTPARHLGLIPAVERRSEAVGMLDELADVVADALALDQVLGLAGSAPPLIDPPWSPADEVGEPVPGRPRFAVAGGPAFTFVYTEHRELLDAAGAEVVTVDPLRDEALPEGTAGLYLGGGFPEVHAEDLSANVPLRRAVADLAAAGAPVVAECGGLLYLSNRLDGEPMCGVIDAEATFTEKLTLGYRDAVAATDSVLGPAGTTVPGHEFHRTTVTPRAGGSPAWALGDAGPEGFVQGGVHASYLHAGWVSTPGVAPALVAAAARFRDGSPAGAGEDG